MDIINELYPKKQYNEQEHYDNNLLFKGYLVRSPNDKRLFDKDNVIFKLNADDTIEGEYRHSNSVGNLTNDILELSNQCHCNDTDGCTCGDGDLVSKQIEKLREEEAKFVKENKILLLRQLLM
jgi:hypothetical protein